MTQVDDHLANHKSLCGRSDVWSPEAREAAAEARRGHSYSGQTEEGLSEYKPNTPRKGQGFALGGKSAALDPEKIRQARETRERTNKLLGGGS